MLFYEAFNLAYDNSAYFRDHVQRVKQAVLNEEQSACLLFTIDGVESFAYGTSGCGEITAIKHTPKRSKYLIDSKQVYHINILKREGFYENK